MVYFYKNVVLIFQHIITQLDNKENVMPKQLDINEMTFLMEPDSFLLFTGAGLPRASFE